MDEISQAELTGHSQLTRHDLEQHLRSARNRAPSETRIFGFYLPTGQIDFDALTIDGEQWRLVQASSELAIRDAMNTQQNSEAAQPDELLAIVTSLRARALANDVRIRLPDAQLFGFDPWESLQTLFGATQIDWKLNRRDAHPLGRALLRLSDGRNFPVVEAGVLDADTAWNTYYERALGFENAPTRLGDWIGWATSHPHELDHLLSDDPTLLELLIARLCEQFGDAARTFFAVAKISANTASEALFGANIMAVGLAIHAAQSADDADPELAVPAALLRNSIEFKYDLSDVHEDAPHDLDAFADEASHAWAQGHEAAVVSALDTILRAESKADANKIAAFSPASELGWFTRLERASEALIAQVDTNVDPNATPDALLQATDAVAAHHLAADAPGLVATLKDAARLAFWLSSHAAPTSRENTAAALARTYIEELSFVDTLRERLNFCDAGLELAPAIERITTLAEARSDAFNEAFARDLANSLTVSADPKDALGMHQVLGEVVAPLVAEQNVLLLVLDGVSWGVARALLADPGFKHWNTWAPARDQQLTPLLATIPSVTAFSRTSLLTGELQSGDQSVEKREFPKHPALRAALSPGAKMKLRKATLFHKKELDASNAGNVGPEVKDAIDDPQHGVVGVVVNAIDDQLGAADQTAFDWSLDTITPLRSLLQRARSADRTVILVGDHGHVWDSHSQNPIKANSQRWRPANGEPIDGELRVEGPMIQTLTGESAVIVPWSEHIRYTGAKRGYHGGASAQELVTPLLILTADGVTLPAERFRSISTVPPDWWRLETVAQPTRLQVAPKAPAKKPSPQLDLLAPSEPKVAPTHAPSDPLIAKLLASATFKTQLEHFGRHLDPDDARDTLAVLRANDDRTSIASLARAIDLNISRTQRQLIALSNVLNRDGSPVLRVYRTDGHVRLDPDLLTTQFQLS